MARPRKNNPGSSNGTWTIHEVSTTRKASNGRFMWCCRPEVPNIYHEISPDQYTNERTEIAKHNYKTSHLLITAQGLPPLEYKNTNWVDVVLTLPSHYIGAQGLSARANHAQILNLAPILAYLQHNVPLYYDRCDHVIRGSVQWVESQAALDEQKALNKEFYVIESLQRAYYERVYKFRANQMMRQGTQYQEVPFGSLLATATSAEASAKISAEAQLWVNGFDKFGRRVRNEYTEMSNFAEEARAAALATLPPTDSATMAQNMTTGYVQVQDMTVGQRPYTAMPAPLELAPATGPAPQPAPLANVVPEVHTRPAPSPVMEHKTTYRDPSARILALQDLQDNPVRDLRSREEIQTAISNQTPSLVRVSSEDAQRLKVAGKPMQYYDVEPSLEEMDDVMGTGLVKGNKSAALD